MDVKEFELRVKGKWYNAVNVCIGSDNRTLVSCNGTLVELDSLEGLEKDTDIKRIDVFSFPETKAVWID